MKTWLLPVYAVIGFVLILLAVPTSRWVVLKQLDVVAGKWRFDDGRDGFGHPYLQPVYPELASPIPAQDETARFLQLLTAPAPAEEAAKTRIQRYFDLYDLCRAKDEPRYLAQFISRTDSEARIYFDWPIHKAPGDRAPISRNHIKEDIPEVQTRFRDACLEGERLDPGNAFFSALLAGVLNRLGDLKGSRAAFLRAGAATRFEDYRGFAPEVKTAYILSHYGDRGNQPRAIAQAGMGWNASTWLFTVGLYFSEEKDLTARLAAVRLGTLMVTQEKSDQGVMIGRMIIDWAIRSNIGRQESGLTIDPKAVTRFVTQTAGVPDARESIERAAALYASIARNFHNSPDYGDRWDLIDNLGPGYSAWSLWALVLIPVGLGVAALKVRDTDFSAASPYLVWITSFVVALAFGRLDASSRLFSLTALLFFPALFPRIRKYVDWVGLGILVMASYFALGCPTLAVPILLFAFGARLERRWVSIPTAITAGALVVACVIGSGVWVSMATREGILSGIACGLIAILGASAAVPVRSPVRWSILAGAACLVLGVWYGVTVERDISADRVLGLVCDSLKHEGDWLRGER